MAIHDLLRNIPKIDKLAQDTRLASYNKISSSQTNEALREAVVALRQDILDEKINQIPTDDELISKAIVILDNHKSNDLIPVINATGVVLHTNFGRSPLSSFVVAEASAVASGYCNLEYNLDKGVREGRCDRVEQTICELTGAEDALVVNNNVAAVILTLTTLAKGKKIAISRGELVEIGGSFRLPEIIEATGCELLEVGSTNVTRIEDFSRVIDDTTGALLKVNQSNFAFVGYTEEVSLSDLANLAHDHDIPCIYDMGSGLIFSLERYGIMETTVSKALSSGVDIATFSCDKLLGGPQAGVIVGKAEYVEQIRKSPLVRAMRVDKFNLAALQSTLRKYSSFNEASEHVAALKMISEDQETLRLRAQTIKNRIIEKLNLENQEHAEDILSVVPVEDTPGGGCAPDCVLPGFAIAISSDKADKIAHELRLAKTPIIAVRKEDQVLLSVRCIMPSQIETVIHEVSDVIGMLVAGDLDA